MKPAQARRVDMAFTHHPPKDESQVERCRLIRGELKDLAALLCGLCPDSRELNKAIGGLEEAQHRAIAAIARNE